MRLFIKEKVFSWGDQFAVLDEYGGEKYFVKGEVFSFGKRLHIYNRDGVEIAFIKQELLSFLPCYHVFVGGRQVAQIKQQFSFLSPRYYVSGPEWEVTGHFLEHDYEISKGGIPIMSIKKEWMTWGDCYELNIQSPADEQLALATVITIDCIVESRDN